MKFVTYEYMGQACPGVLDCDRVYPLKEFGYDQTTLERFIAESTGTVTSLIREKLPGASGIPVSEIRLLPPIPAPGQEIIIMQNNYARTASETEQFHGLAAEKKLYPTYYYKRAAAPTTDGWAIKRYEGFLNELDLQVELCAVLGRGVYRCSEADVRIFGYMVINNVIAHDITVRHRRPFISTGLDSFLPMSPWIVSADEFEENHVFRLRSYVNEELRQEGDTSLRIFGPEFAFADLSQAGVVEGASILSTGTPFGNLRDLGLGYLKAGDKVRCEVEGVGSVTNVVK